MLKISHEFMNSATCHLMLVKNHLDTLKLTISFNRGTEQKERNLLVSAFRKVTIEQAILHDSKLIAANPETCMHVLTLHSKLQRQLYADE